MLIQLRSIIEFGYAKGYTIKAEGQYFRGRLSNEIGSKILLLFSGPPVENLEMVPRIRHILTTSDPLTTGRLDNLSTELLRMGQYDADLAVIQRFLLQGDMSKEELYKFTYAASRGSWVVFQDRQRAKFVDGKVVYSGAGTANVLLDGHNVLIHYVDDMARKIEIPNTMSSVTSLTNVWGRIKSEIKLKGVEVLDTGEDFFIDFDYGTICTNENKKKLPVYRKDKIAIMEPDDYVVELSYHNKPKVRLMTTTKRGVETTSVTIVGYTPNVNMFDSHVGEKYIKFEQMVSLSEYEMKRVTDFPHTEYWHRFLRATPTIVSDLITSAVKNRNAVRTREWIIKSIRDRAYMLGWGMTKVANIIQPDEEQPPEFTEEQLRDFMTQMESSTFTTTVGADFPDHFSSLLEDENDMIEIENDDIFVPEILDMLGRVPTVGGHTVRVTCIHPFWDDLLDELYLKHKEKAKELICGEFRVEINEPDPMDDYIIELFNVNGRPIRPLIAQRIRIAAPVVVNRYDNMV
jgi:hypothetical protein